MAKKAVERGLRAKPWVKTSLAPGSRVVIDYLDRAGLMEPLQQLGFYLVGYGCTTCIGNSGPLLDGVTDAVQGRGPVGRLGALGQPELRGTHPPRRADELPRVAAAGGGLRAGGDDGHRPHHRAHRATTPMATRCCCPTSGRPMDEVSETIRASLTSDMFRTRYSAVFDGDEYWQQVADGGGRDLRVAGRLHLREEPALLREA